MTRKHGARTSRATAVLGTIALLTLVSGTVVAQNFKIMPGSACKRASGSHPINLFGHYVDNSSSTTKTVTYCPLVRDDETDSKWDNNILVYVRDNRSDDHVRCDGIIGIYNSTAYYYVSRTTTNAQVGNYGLSIPPPAGTYGASSPWALRCYLPRGNGSDYAKVYSYNHHE